MTLQQCVDLHNAAQPAPATLTPLGRATCLARRFAEALADLEPQDRQNLLMQIVCSAAPGPEGMGFGLTISVNPMRDPAA